MSLKAKIEAVIYAAEEPVTLAQLAAIFAAEVPAAPTHTATEDNSPQQLDAFFAESSQPAATHEFTTIDDAGNMADAPPQANDEPGGGGAPRLDSESMDTAPAITAAVLSSSDLETDAEQTLEAAKRSNRLREKEVREYIRTLVDELISDFSDDGKGHDRGMEIREIAGGYRMATKPEYHDAVRGFVKSLKPAMKLSLQALETLAVIAYKQPVTSPEVAEIRGVDSGGVLANLISRKLVTTAGRKQVIGRPILYKTTKEFLLRFGLKDIAELPSMEEFEKMAGDLAESDALEADAMHEKAGIEAASEAGTEKLPFEQDAANAPSLPETEESTESSSQPDNTPELSSRPEQSEAKGPASSSHDAPADHEHNIAVTEEVQQPQES